MKLSRDVLLASLAVAAAVSASHAVGAASPHARAAKPFVASPTTVNAFGNGRLKPSTRVDSIPRGGSVGDAAKEAASTAAKSAAASGNGNAVLAMVQESLNSLQSYVSGKRADTLILLLTTALNTPVCTQLLKISPILGFLVLGILLGPNGLSCIHDVHTTELFADLGIVLFLFEMGIHLDINTLLSMRRDVFGLGLSQFLITGAAIAAICTFGLGLSAAASMVIGGALALSSSAFVLQLLKDKDQLSTQFGRSSFGVLLLQDLAVVPILVLTPLLAGGGTDQSMGQALGQAGVQAAIALSLIAVAGKFLIGPFYKLVDAAKNQDCLVGAILGTVLTCSFLTEGLGLSNTLGAFLAGVLMSETPYKHDIEREISPFRGILVGLFFFTVGFEIDLPLIVSRPGAVAGIVCGIVALKAGLAALIAKGFGLPNSIAQHVGLILSQGGEFAFVTFRLARSVGLLTGDQTKMLLTCVALTMGLTPFLEEMGSNISSFMQEKEAETEQPSVVVQVSKASKRTADSIFKRNPKKAN